MSAADADHPPAHRPAGSPPSAAVPGAPTCDLGESARWHDDAWWWVDVPTGTVYRWPGEERPVERWLQLAERVSMIYPAGPDRMLLARGSVLEIRRISRPGETERVIAELRLPVGWALNDGMLDPAGTVWIGVVAPAGARSDGWLARVTPDGGVHRAVEGVLLSNGLALAPDGHVLYHADSARRVVWRHRLSVDGRVIESAEFIRLAPEDGMPDGLCLDDSGRLWVAIYGSGEIRCYTDGADQVAAVGIPAPQATSVCVGGPGGRGVIITSAREGYDAARRAAEPLAGATFFAPGITARREP